MQVQVQSRCSISFFPHLLGLDGSLFPCWSTCLFTSTSTLPTSYTFLDIILAALNPVSTVCYLLSGCVSVSRRWMCLERGLGCIPSLRRRTETSTGLAQAIHKTNSNTTHQEPESRLSCPPPALLHTIIIGSDGPPEIWRQGKERLAANPYVARHSPCTPH